MLSVESRETILISMVSTKNSVMVGELLGKDYNIIYEESEIPDEGDGPGLWIMDLPRWAANREEMKLRKQNEAPLFLPYLLVISHNDLLKVQKDVWTSFDEVITVPITKMVLQSRVKVLLQTRQLSVQVNHLLQDKEMLMKEIHHRVKNNLMIISSLLSMQARQIKDEATREVFKESQTRARSMALIHERLYRSNDLKSVDFPDYTRSLVRDIFNTYRTEQKIELKMDIQDVMVDVDYAVPLGLIINEIITNSLKYAFPPGREGVVWINFHKNGDEYFLEAGDDGVGIQDDVDLKKSDSLGMLLVNSLTAQIDGELELDSQEGTIFRIKFKEKSYG
ncbi:MAG: Signal transduction histidine kinase [Methanobacterium sp. 42_16]|nr:MAG: Signal transduction histidine kinase [Methanobacterium sp. 42_16]